MRGADILIYQLIFLLGYRKQLTYTHSYDRNKFFEFFFFQKVSAFYPPSGEKVCQPLRGQQKAFKHIAFYSSVTKLLLLGGALFDFFFQKCPAIWQRRRRR